MSPEFPRILQGLMGNRHLSTRVVSRASGRAESTIIQLLNGSVQPTVEVIQDIAPVLELTTRDLLVVAGVSGEPPPDRPRPYPAAIEIGRLIALASGLTSAQVEQLVRAAEEFRRGQGSSEI